VYIQGEKARAATVRGFFFWCIGIALLVVNWVWLQAFVLIYMKEANTPTRISIGVIVFNVSEALFAKAVRVAMNHAELERVGTRHASFDRFHLRNLSTYAFLCYSAIFRQSLFVNITDWESFASFYLTNSLSYVIGFVVPMSEKAHNVASAMKTTGEGTCWSAVAHAMFHPDLLHQRGSLCFKAYLKNRANTIASLQYATFILFVGLSGHNAKVFLNFSDGAEFDLQQQLLFVLIAWILDFINYTLTNMMCTRAYDITPFYVGTACLKQYPRTRRALFFIAAHIISDVYLGMVFAMEGGIYFADELDAAGLLDGNSTGGVE